MEKKKQPHSTYEEGQGRPAVRKRIVEAASLEFMEKGFDGASMDGILRRAGGSKRTLYRHFPDKPALFNAVIREQSRQVSDGFLKVLSDARPPEQVLYEAAEQIYDYCVVPNRRSLLRVMLAASNTFPELPEVVYDFGVNSSAGPFEPLVQYFKTLHDQGRLTQANSRSLAELFVHSTLGGIRFLMLPNLQPAARKKWFRQVVEIFLRGVLKDGRQHG